MGPAEIAGRSVRELRKRLDRRGLAAKPHPGSGVLGALAPDATLDTVRARVRAGDVDGAGALLLERFLEAAPARFFEGAVSPDVPGELRRRMRGADAALVDEAESVLAGHFDLLGYRGLSFGDPIDWHLDPVSGKRAPLVHWTDVDFLDAVRVGDSKVIWELNRHQWLVRLGQAYRMTGDERYAERFAATIVEWRLANPPGVGINWASSLEVAFRIISWSWAVMLFRGSRALGPELFVEILEGVAGHAAHVERYLSRYYSPNTHLTGEALGLFYAGLVFPELRGARRWQRLGHRILVDEVDRQVLSDGFHFERSTCYHRYTVEIFLHFVLLAARNAVPLPRRIAERLQSMVDVLLALREPDGSMPAIGDADGGSLLPLAPRPRGDLRGVFAVAAAVFQRPDYAWAAQGPGPEALWLCGPARSAVESLAPRAPETAASSLFADGGYAVMRSGWDRRAHQLVFDTGPLGCPVSAGHGHADLLGIQCAVFGEPTIADPGTFCYTAEPAWRDFFRGTAAHSTVRVDGLDQVIPRGPFSWQARPSARLARWVTTESLDVADAEHDAYARLADPVTHRRRVLWIKPRYWIIIDDLGGVATHAVELRFQFAPIEVTVGPALWARAHAASGPGLFIHPFSTAPLTAEVTAGRTSPAGGWISRDYGQREPAPLLIYRATTRLPLRVATLLFPADAGLPSPPDVATIRDHQGQVIGLRLHGGDESVRFDEPEALISRRGTDAAPPGSAKQEE
jgi:hypothetical protein